MSGNGDGVDIIPLSERERWEREHAMDGRPTQSWAYARAIAESGSPINLAVVTAGGARLLLPFFERAYQGSVDIATPLGLSGASLDQPSMSPWELWREFAVGRRWVAGYVQLAHDVTCSPRHELDRIVESNAVIVLDLTRGSALRGASEIVRRKVRRALRSGAELVFDQEHLATPLARLYPPTMDRVHGANVYRHSQSTLQALAALPEALTIGVAINGVIEAVSVFVRAGSRAEYLCNACSDSGRSFAAWLIVVATERLQSMGVRELNLGGGVRPGDGLYEFKARFNGVRRPLRALRQIYDPERYSELCGGRAHMLGDGWFPAYRQP